MRGRESTYESVRKNDFDGVPTIGETSKTEFEAIRREHGYETLSLPAPSAFSLHNLTSININGAKHNSRLENTYLTQEYDPDMIHWSNMAF